MKYEDYLVVGDASVEALTIKVRERMKENWVPCGGMSIDFSGRPYGRQTIFYQAMKKRKKRRDTNENI